MDSRKYDETITRSILLGALMQECWKQESPSKKAHGSIRLEAQKQTAKASTEHSLPRHVRYSPELSYSLPQQHSFPVPSPETLTSKCSTGTSLLSAEGYQRSRCCSLKESLSENKAPRISAQIISWHTIQAKLSKLKVIGKDGTYPGIKLSQTLVFRV